MASSTDGAESLPDPISPGPALSVVCAKCGIQFIPTPQQAGMARRLGCRLHCPTHYRGRRSPHYQPAGPETCANCGETFIATALQRTRWKRLFCSDECCKRVNNIESNQHPRRKIYRAREAEDRIRYTERLAALKDTIRNNGTVIYDREKGIGDIPVNLRHYV